MLNKENCTCSHFITLYTTLRCRDPRKWFISKADKKNKNNTIESDLGNWKNLMDLEKLKRAKEIIKGLGKISSAWYCLCTSCETGIQDKYGLEFTEEERKHIKKFSFLLAFERSVEEFINSMNDGYCDEALELVEEQELAQVAIKVYREQIIKEIIE